MIKAHHKRAQSHERGTSNHLNFHNNNIGLRAGSLQMADTLSPQMGLNRQNNGTMLQDIKQKGGKHQTYGQQFPNQMVSNIQQANRKRRHIMHDNLVNNRTGGETEMELNVSEILGQPIRQGPGIGMMAPPQLPNGNRYQNNIGTRGE